MTSNGERANIKMDLYLGMIDELCRREKAYAPLLTKLRIGIDSVFK